jgi:hypothetical protein
VLTGTRLHAAVGDSEQISADVDVDADHVIDPVRQRLDHEPGARADVEQAGGRRSGAASRRMAATSAGTPDRNCR